MQYLGFVECKGLRHCAALLIASHLLFRNLYVPALYRRIEQLNIHQSAFLHPDSGLRYIRIFQDKKKKRTPRHNWVEVKAE